MSAQQREGLVQEGGTLGLRPFDASLIIAIAQDHARTGRSLAEVAPTLRLVDPVQPERNAWTSLRPWLLVTAACLLVGIALVVLA